LLKAGTGGTTAPLAIEALAAAPASVSPNGDGQADTTTVGFTLTAAASVDLDVFDTAQNDVLPVLADQRFAAGKQSVAIDPAPLADGSYTIVVRARGDGGSDVESVIPFTVSRLLGLVAAIPPLFSPNGDGRNDTLTVTYALTAPANVQVTIARDGKWVATPLVAVQQAGPQTLTWDGSRSGGTLRDGAYTVTVTAANEIGATSFSIPFTVDTTPPRVQLVSRKPFVLSLSEPVTLTARIDGRVVRKKVRHASRIRIPLERPFRRAVVTAVDAAGNASTSLVVRQKAKKPAQ
jgi:hypothetical protein